MFQSEWPSKCHLWQEISHQMLLHLRFVYMEHYESIHMLLYQKLHLENDCVLIHNICMIILFLVLLYYL